jgi:hypothetical protein
MIRGKTYLEAQSLEFGANISESTNRFTLLRLQVGYLSVQISNWAYVAFTDISIGNFPETGNAAWSTNGTNKPNRGL